MDGFGLRHRDASGRVTFVDQKDASRERYIRPSDGRLAPLVVQGVDEENLISDAKGWTGSGRIRLQVSPILDLVHWTYSSVFKEGSEERHYDAKSMTSLLLKWFPSCIILVLLLIIPQDLEGIQSNGGFYDPIRYRDWGYSKVSRNAAENRREDLDEPQENEPLLPDDVAMTIMSPPSHATDNSRDVEDEVDQLFDDLPARQFRPRYLCFLGRDSRAGVRCETWKVTDWIQEHGESADTDFIFLSYTRKQFCVGTDQEISVWDLPDEETRAAYISIARQDRTTLLQHGIQAALSAGKSAFWLDFECIRDADNAAKATSQSEDVYRICDIARAAHSLVILTGPPLPSRLPNGTPQSYNPHNMSLWLHEWGTRLWTLPEILLCSPEHRVKIYAIGGPSQPELLAKRNFAARAWKDAKLVRQLVDHYESSIHLTPLELVSIALECFASRQTDQFNKGDIAYALMGLLRRRPAVNKSDTGFEAFARLSLANDSDALLERLLCMMPLRPDAPWHEIKDAWGARLWDIEPRCQVASIVNDETVTLDGAFGATIQWDSMDQVAFFKRPTIARTFGKILLRGLPAYLIPALILTITGSVYMTKYADEKKKYEADKNSDSVYMSQDAQEPSEAYKSLGLGLLIPGLIFLLPSAVLMMCAPAMLLDIYRGKFWSTQAQFVGIEGKVDIGEAERHLFGFNHGRLKWSTSGSTLSRHRHKDGECVPLPPALNTSAESIMGRAVFTLIDTYAMTATCFYAERPPVAVILCGQEGGMQRAVLCSYDWRTQTFARETVLRMKTLVLDRMFRVDRFKFALRRQPHAKDAQELGQDERLASIVESKDRKGNKVWRMWKIDLLLLPLMWFINGAPVGGPSTWMDGVGDATIATYAGMFAALIPAVHMLRRAHIGQVISVAIFTWSALSIGSAFVTTRAGYAALAFAMGLAYAFVLPAFVLLTGAWYTPKERILRILTWGYASTLVQGVFETISSRLSNSSLESTLESMDLNIYGLLTIVFAIIFMGFGGFSYFFVGTPEQTRWLSTQDRVRYRDRQIGWKSTGWTEIKISRLLRDAHLWLFFGASLLNKAYLSTARLEPSARAESAYWLVLMASILFALIVGVGLRKLQNCKILTIGTVVSLGFAASITLCVHILDYRKIDYDSRSENRYPDGLSKALAGVLQFMIDVGRISQYLIWLLCLSNTHDITSRLTTIFVTFTGWSIGGIIGGAYWKVANKHKGYWGMDTLLEDTSMYGYIAAVSVLYGLQVSVLVAWYLYSMWANRKLVHGESYSTAPVAESDWSERRGMLGSTSASETRSSSWFCT